MKNINELIIKRLISCGDKNPPDLALVKREISKKYKSECPTNISILKTYHKLVKNGKIKKSFTIESALRTRPVRSLSGIVNISVLTKPYPCPGKCIYCPTEKNIPKSYVSGEPAVERAKKLKFNPYLQTKKRIEMLDMQGHPTDKIELRVVGGTWSYYPKEYQIWFIEQCFRACNEERSSKIPNFKSQFSNKSQFLNFKTLRSVQRKNETAEHRIVGLSIETRPDFINKEEIKHLRELGVTMVEMGVQSIYNDVLKLNNREHSVEQTILATKLLKDAGFKVLYQVMPNLYGSSFKKDLQMFKELFLSPDFQPDLLKIYPCALLKNTGLYKIWMKKNYKPYTEKQLTDLLIKIKKIIPRYIRIQRITRDIPSNSIVEGAAKVSNVRQLLKNRKVSCECIRCREIKDDFNPKEKLYLFRENYLASNGREIFLSWENKSKTKLYSLLRLRINGNK
jgi:elongator complex protein 3